MKLKKILLILFSLFFLGISFSLINKCNHDKKNDVVFSRQTSGQDEKGEEGSDEKRSKKQVAVRPKILVHISGAVKYPGLYEVSVGTRSIDLIKEAGGLLSLVDLSKVNFANRLKDGQHVHVPFLVSRKIKKGEESEKGKNKKGEEGKK